MTTKHTPSFTPGPEVAVTRKSAIRMDGGDEVANARLITASPDLLRALKFQASWTMRDGTPCACPAGSDECEPKGKMPTMHSTSCEMLRAAIAKAKGQETKP